MTEWTHDIHTNPVTIHFNDVLQQDDDAEIFIYDANSFGTDKAFCYLSEDINGRESITIPHNEDLVIVAIGMYHACYIKEECDGDSEIWLNAKPDLAYEYVNIKRLPWYERFDLWLDGFEQNSWLGKLVARNTKYCMRIGLETTTMVMLDTAVIDEGDIIITHDGNRFTVISIVSNTTLTVVEK